MLKKLPIVFILLIGFLLFLPDVVEAKPEECGPGNGCYLNYCEEWGGDPDCSDIGTPCDASRGDCGTQLDNLCCRTSGGCSSGGRLGCDPWMAQWTWCHSPSCVVVAWRFCDWKWVFKDCGATDSCLPVFEFYLK